MVQSAPFLIAKVAMTVKAASQQTSLKRRIRQFYELLEQQDFARCHQMIDPRVRQKPSSVTLLQYQNSLQEFLAAVGTIDVERIDVELHLGESNRLYENRDFAVGQTWWTDDKGEQHQFAERWVRDGRTWFTRSTGLVPPSPATASAAGKTNAHAAKAQRSTVVRT
jgi:hypothetical protein